MLGLWALEIYRPMLSYPANGIAEIVGWVIVVVASALLAWAGGIRSGNAAGMLGSVFIGWMGIRWVGGLALASGAPNFGTLVISAAAAAASYRTLQASSTTGRNSPSTLLRIFFGAWLGIAVVCGLHAIAQYLWLYDRAFDALTREIGSAAPSALEKGLLYHFRVKRVASVWGDPNSLGAFLALSLAPALYFIRSAWRERRSSRRALPACTAAAFAAVIVLVALGLTRSRGAMLDVVLILVLLGGATLIAARRTLAAAALIVCSLALHAQTSVPAPAPETTQNSLIGRTNTIRERVFYAKVGLGIWKDYPIAGAGVGSIDIIYAHYKPAEARETKFLHNWFLQFGAEGGIVAVVLAMAFAAALFWRAWPSRRDPELLIAIVMTAVFLADALYQHSIYQRELMIGFGMLCGILLFAGARGTQARVGFTTIALVAVMLAVLLPWTVAANYRQRADDAIEAGDMEPADTWLNAALVWTPRDPSLFTRLSFVERQRAGLAASLPYLERAVRLQPVSASLHAQMADLLLRLGNTGRSRAEIEHAIKLYPTNPEYRLQYARLLDSLGDRLGAIKQADMAVQWGHEDREKFAEYASSLRQPKKP